MKKKILIITTGGTIAMKYDKEYGIVPSNELVTFLRSFPNINKDHLIEIREFSNIPSPHMTPQKMLELAFLIRENKDEFDGFVITHGTDTLEETAYFLDIVLEIEKPVVLTAAMRNNPSLGMDGPRNIVGAVRVASSKKSFGLGVMVVMNDEIHEAREIVKIDTAKVNAFNSLEAGVLGSIDPDKIIFFRKLKHNEILNINKIDERIDLLRTSAGMNPHLIDACVKNGSKGIILEAFGRGNIPSTIIESVKKAVDSGIVVVIVSRSIKGRVLPHYGYEGGGKHLQEIGVIFGEDLSGHKARLKLMALFGKYKTIEEVKKNFNRY